MAALPGRARRFAARLRGEHVPTFNDLVDPPAWKQVAAEHRTDLAVTMALLKSRPAIDGELNGQKLASLAEFVGEERFDEICEVDCSVFDFADEVGGLPNPLELIEQGEKLIDAAEMNPDLAMLAETGAAILQCEQTRDVSGD